MPISRHKIFRSSFLTLRDRVVNITARVQSRTRECGVDVLLGREVPDTLDPRYMVRELPATSLYGVGRPVEVLSPEALKYANETEHR